MTVTSDAKTKTETSLRRVEFRDEGDKSKCEMSETSLRQVRLREESSLRRVQV